MESDNESSVIELLKEKHRKEKKELQVTISNLRYSIDRNDKRKKKELNAKIEQLEDELSKRHKAELKEVLENETTTNENGGNEEVVDSQGAARISKAEKRRIKKADKRQHLLRAEEEDMKNMAFSAGKIERTDIENTLAERNLEIYEILPDGDCLFNAIAHQYSVVENLKNKITGSEMREKAAKHIRNNRDDYFAFLTDANGEPIKEEDFEKYCEKVEKNSINGGDWGGEVELRALSCALERRIEVVQAKGTRTFGDHLSNTNTLIVTYHHAAYYLGEHYNSTQLLTA